MTTRTRGRPATRNGQWGNVGVPKELLNEIAEIARAEDRTRYAVVKRAIALYKQQSESAAALK
jgi:predicted transcriptional regulator